MSKMYIAVLDEVPDHMVPVLVAHATLRHHLHWWNVSQMYMSWVQESFKKVVLRVNQKEFTKIHNLGGTTASWENSTLEGKISCITVVVDEEVPNVLRYAKMWKPEFTQQ